MGKEKKEIGMQKLIELLNEYKKIKGYDGNTKITNYDTDTGSFTNGYSGLEYEIVIGKRYGFVKWLVENEKTMVIDKEIGTSEEDYICGTKYRLFKECYSDYEILLMLLSISDTPIEDLLLYLK